MASGLAHIDALLDRPAQVGFSEPMDIDESAEELDASKSAVVPQAKRPCLERHSAPAAAGGGGVSSGPQEEGQANDQQQQQKQLAVCFRVFIGRVWMALRAHFCVTESPRSSPPLRPPSSADLARISTPRRTT